jgi:uncharacterized protein YraI
MALAGLAAVRCPVRRAGAGADAGRTGHRPGVTTIGNIAPNARVNLRSGPAAVFPPVATLGYGTRVRVGPCIGGGSARFCQVNTVDGALSGFVSAGFLVQGAAPPAGGDDGLDGGPDYWVVRGLSAGDRLNVRRDPTTRSPALATLREGEVVQNLGCRMTGNTRWCRIRSTTGMDVTGWVAGRYLREYTGRPPTGGGWSGGSGASGPDTWVVTGLPAGDTLNLRAQPSAQAQILARLQPGVRLVNLGCRMVGQTRWCQVRTIGGVDLTGWLNGRYLREG